MDRRESERDVFPEGKGIEERSALEEHSDLPVDAVARGAGNAGDFGAVETD